MRRTQRPPTFALSLGSLLHLHCIIYNEVHELIKSLYNFQHFLMARPQATYSNLALDSNRQLFV